MNILQMSGSAALLVIAIVIVRALGLNRLPKKMFLILWGVTLCRLLIPFSLPSGFSIYRLANAVVPRASSGISQTITPSISLPSDLGAMALPIETGAQRTGVDIDPMTLIWLIGSATMLIFFAVAYHRNRKELKLALPIEGNGIIDQWLAAHDMARPVKILQSSRIFTPVSTGILHPCIILPKSMDMNDQQLMRYVLTHEQCHLKRFDMLWKMLLILALCVHWFNPLVWVMFILANRDLELACDESVIRHFGVKTKTEYALSLIGMAEQRSKFTPLYNGFSKNAAEERIVSIMKTKKLSLISILAACFIIVGVTTAFATSAATNENKPSNHSITSSDLTNNSHDVPIDVNSGDVSDNQGKTLAEVFAQYKAYGIEFSPVSGRGGEGNVFYQEQAVNSFIDILPNGDVLFVYSSLDGGEIDVRTVYDGNGKFAGITIDSDSFETDIEPYKSFGVSFESESPLVMKYEGHPVREIWDPVAGVIITESIGPNGFGGRAVPDGAVDLTAIYENGYLVGFHVSTQEEYDLRTQERREHVSGFPAEE